MKKVVFILSVLVMALPLYGQRVETREPGQDQIVRVATALNHLTVIQLSEAVLSVAAGSEAFKVEWRGNKVFVEPTEAGVSTNLFIWTKSGRENYELEPAGSVETMDFAIDAPAPDPKPAPKIAVRVTVPNDPIKLAADEMLGGTPVRQERWKFGKHRVQVMVRDLFEENGNLYIRYSIENGTKKTYAPGTPRAVEMTDGISRAVLAAHAYTQLSKETARNLRPSAETHLTVSANELRCASVGPGQVSVGVVAVKLAGSGPAVVRLEFNDAGGHAVNAVVVI